MIEYQIISARNQKELQAEINRASAEGWKVVCSCGKRNDKIILKRRLRMDD